MNKLLILILGAFVLSLFVPAVISQYPPLNFHQFYGSVTGVGPGTNITATVGTNTFTTTVSANRTYGYTPALFFVQGTNGQTIRFVIRGQQVATRVFQTGGVTQLNLVYTAAPTPVPPPPTTGGGGGGGRRARDWYRNITAPTPAPTPTAPIECFDDWICDAWGPCEAPGMQKRECFLNDYPNCTSALPKPPEEQSCELPPPPPPAAPTCFDGIKNQDETYTDCGGSKCKQCDPYLDCLFDRDCITGYCNPATQLCGWKPVEIPKPPPPKPSYWWIWLIVGGIIIAGAGLGLLFYIEHKRKLEMPEEEIPAKLRSLKRYAQTFIDKGVPKERIAAKLKEAGWKPDDIRKVLK